MKNNFYFKQITASALLFLILINHAKAQTGTYIPELANFDAAIQTLMYEYDVPGGQMAISYKGRLVYSRGFGFANIAAMDSVQPTSLFRIASISKPVTGIAIMRLFEDGMIDLDAKVFGAAGILNDAAYEDILDPQVLNITVRELLHHSGGWNSDISGDPMFDAYGIATAMGATPPADPMVVIQYELAYKMLDFAPGTQSHYSNFGYCILGKVIEKISGESYEDYVRNSVLIPLGITDMHLGFNLLADQLPNEVTYYDYPGAPMAYSVYDNTSIVPWPYGGFNLEAMDAHGRWIASAQDLCKLLCAVDGFNTYPDIFSSATIDTMIEPSAVSPNYALGWNVNPYNNWWHLGSIPGTTTEIIRDGNDQINWVALLNTRTASVSDISGALDNLLWTVKPTIVSWPSIDLFTGVEEIQNENTFSVYPDPANDAANISLQFTDGINAELKVFNVMGKEVYTNTITGDNYILHTSEFPSGTYFIQLRSENKILTQQLIIQH